jgi:zinc/manganese transport system ATP-binding protein
MLWRTRSLKGEGDKLIVTIMLEIRHLHCAYGEKTILDDLSLYLEGPQLVAVIGPNGCGKTTFLKAVSGLLPYGGVVEQTYGSFAYLPQQSLLDRSFPLTVFDAVCMGLYSSVGAFKGFSSHDTQAVYDALKAVGMTSFSHEPLIGLSGGQFQRVLFARLMVQKDDLLLLDEPFSAVDETTVHILMNLLLTWFRGGKTIFVVVHHLSLVRQFFPHTLLLTKGQGVFGKTDAVLTPETLEKLTFSAF